MCLLVTIIADVVGFGVATAKGTGKSLYCSFPVSSLTGCGLMAVLGSMYIQHHSKSCVPLPRHIDLTASFSAVVDISIGTSKSLAHTNYSFGLT